ncbi:hypothetical protein HPT27_12130 [Permianibacter sp. IMCC34836]|uniref:hypothetical protein n=1 Tax=Permianibacter fluminis TaxID=2738515 RepID=UPI0015562C0C|nr:hypothetical protein [Permianibacter fluminis]NQD37776.1 hypothetical protein [Permianibacter fluminis]
MPAALLLSLLALARPVAAEDVLLAHGCVVAPATDPEQAARWESEGLPVGNVDINMAPIFDEANPDENNWLFRGINAIHIDTDPDVVREDLLFQEGEPFSAQKLEESERVLRTRGYLRNPRIVPVGDCAEKVDLQVQAREVWTLVPELGYAHKGGQTTTRFGIKDKNFLGTGKSVAFQHENDPERSSDVLSYKDVNFTDLRAILDVEYGDTSDGQYYQFDLGRPFFSLDTEWSAGAHAFDSTRIDSVYVAGDVIQEFQQHEQNYELSYGWSEGLVAGATSRWRVGVHAEQHTFDRSPDTVALPPLPLNRELQYPWVGYQYIDDQFITARNVNQIGIVEDLNTGWDVDVRLGYAKASALTAEPLSQVTAFNDTAVMMSITARRNLLFSDDKIFGFSFGFDGQYQDSGLQNSVADLLAQYHHGDFSTHQFYAGLQLSQGWNLPVDRLLYLGGDNGLRGYPRNYQAGDQRALLTLEERFYLKEEWLSLADVGAAVFYDVGRATGLSDQPNEWLQDIGFGLRLSPTRTGAHRSGRNSVLHLDVAVPLGAPSDVGRWQWLVQVKESF